MACANSSARAALRAVCTAVPAVAALALPAFAAGQSPVESPISIELRPQVKLDQSSVRLGDIAYLTARDLPTLRRLMALPLGPAPRPGSPATLDRDTIVRWVEARSGLQTVDSAMRVQSPAIQWTGASETEIESAAQQLPGETVVNAARSALLNWLSQRSVRAEVEPVSTARDLFLPPGATTLRVRPLANQTQPTRRMLVWVDAWVDDRFVRTTAVTFEVGAWAPVTVAATGVGRGATVDAVMLRGATETREVDLTTVRQGKPVATKAGGELADGSERLRRPLRPGEVLTSAHLEATPAVLRGNWAHLLARSGDVSVESRVEVLQDGRQGQVVRVKVPGSSGEVLARVTGPGQVEVQP
ncbi:flagella basal body P-ring formation protein FlgA [Variovorax boronicumulans]|uniref:flagellar basal body P-ring formation chaperone FlgA n=1 Tax=Variovorax boronicumulans TaxID=436515 RepID=UPI0027815F8D|nr:flagellar basal body P-ring formation chaperone FlgA [Variovorax boronicumulans]MDQ0016094.1 flagella basal body P-ring formation protein FlgA [Variovorax boronicumulans]